ncbi:MAG TPA: tRNA (adenosine(37)-N6)-threonylcarbamoyltransferase complex dimerization subunit type 1 TsaB [Pseudobdellovibrionaceae bacterium]|nr:tRNA (adenosine(37)-N6)-threonylcarbamoyltransferase complex dimerization subunit type 1 TsaB [Pseudobdellovibrionaceae bacterium]
MKILAIETCTTHGSLSLVESPSEITERVWATSSWTRSSSHAEHLTIAIEKSRELVGSWQEIGALACGVGPGSFTGIRVGLNAFRAIAWTLSQPLAGATPPGVPLIAVRTTDALVAAGRAALPQARVTAIIPAQMNLYFVSIDGEAPEALELQELVGRLEALDGKSRKENLVLGPARMDFEEYIRGFKPSFRRTSVAAELDWPQATFVARIAAEQIRQSGLTTTAALVQKFHWQLAQPLYLRGSGAEEKMSDRA